MTDNKPQEDEMICGLSVTERDLLQQQLLALPETMPPRAVWQRIEEQAKAEGLFSGNRQLESMKWLGGAAIAATVAMLALNLPFGNGPVIQAVDEFSSVPAEVPAEGPHGLNALQVQSQILERSLRLLPAKPRVMKVSTAATIQELEDQISAIDYRLNDRTIKLDPRQEEIYWGERVRLMKSLIHLRYAQTQRMAF